MLCKLTVGVRLKGRCMRGDSRDIKTPCAARARFDATGVYINLSRTGARINLAQSMIQMRISQ